MRGWRTFPADPPSGCNAGKCSPLLVAFADWVRPPSSLGAAAPRRGNGLRRPGRGTPPPRQRSSSPLPLRAAHLRLRERGRAGRRAELREEGRGGRRPAPASSHARAAPASRVLCTELHSAPFRSCAVEVAGHRTLDGAADRCVDARLPVVALALAAPARRGDAGCHGCGLAHLQQLPFLVLPGRDGAPLRPLRGQVTLSLQLRWLNEVIQHGRLRRQRRRLRHAAPSNAAPALLHPACGRGLRGCPRPRPALGRRCEALLAQPLRGGRLALRRRRVLADGRRRPHAGREACRGGLECVLGSPRARGRRRSVRGHRGRGHVRLPAHPRLRAEVLELQPPRRWRGLLPAARRLPGRAARGGRSAAAAPGLLLCCRWPCASALGNPGLPVHLVDWSDCTRGSGTACRGRKGRHRLLPGVSSVRGGIADRWGGWLQAMLAASSGRLEGIDWMSPFVIFIINHHVLLCLRCEKLLQGWRSVWGRSSGSWRVATSPERTACCIVVTSLLGCRGAQ
mmetsp:Transcript_104543/g.305209  ORF Transcript_104543/g.305209 Transcript_104543/m.305209 type:complete len:510 (-) Transcript_104543:883-2412(-)